MLRPWRTTGAVYDRIGASYAGTRTPDPRWPAEVDAALGRSRTVLDVGAGIGSYEPTDRYVLAVEPSEVMIRQRAPGAPRALQAKAEALPIAERRFDMAMAVSTRRLAFNPQRGGLSRRDPM